LNGCRRAFAARRIADLLTSGRAAVALSDPLLMDVATFELPDGSVPILGFCGERRMRGIDPIVTAIIGRASAYAALLCIIGTRLASYGWQILAGIGEETE
jgi:hypothetical protein